MKEKELRVNAGKTKIMICGRSWTSCRVQMSFNVPSAALEWAATASSAMVQALGAQEMQWAQALDKGPWLPMYTEPENCTPLGSWPQREVQVGPDKLEVVASFCYLGELLSAASGCEHSTTTRVKTACKFKELLPVLSSRHLSFKTRGYMYSSCVGSAMLHASETWPLTKPNFQCLQWNDRSMVRQICNVKSQDIVNIRSNELLAQLGTKDLNLILKERRLRWYGHVECSNGAVKTASDIQVDGKGVPGRPKMIWKQLTKRSQRVEALGYRPSW